VTDRADLATGITPAFAVAVLWQTVFATLGAYGLYWATLARTTATRVGSLIYMTPPVTALWAFAMFGQPITAAHVAGFVVCLAGVALASGSSLGMRPKARARLPAPPRP
jgi:drug/metabolite transporter (DMT)-like permease